MFQYFFVSQIQQWMTWDNATNRYVTLGTQNAVSNEQALQNYESEEVKREKERKEKAKEARRVQKEMEKWAAKNENGTASNSRKSAPPVQQPAFQVAPVSFIF